MTAETLIFSAIENLERAKRDLEAAREADRAVAGDAVDGRAVSIAITHLETAQLWVANARK